VGPRFSGEVREKPQRRERKWGGTAKLRLLRFANPGLAGLELLTRLTCLDSFRETTKLLTEEVFASEISTELEIRIAREGLQRLIAPTGTNYH
jgi:hypothetical protein